MFQFQLNAIKEKPLSLLLPPRLPIYLVGCNMALWNKPAFQFAIKATPGGGRGGGGGGGDTLSVPQLLGSPASFFF